MKQIFLVACQNRENEKRDRLYHIETADMGQYYALRRAGYKSFAFEDQRRERTINILIAFEAKNLERFSAHIYDTIKDHEYVKVSLS